MEAKFSQLEELTLTGVVQTGRKLGSGSWGEVVEVRLSGLKCAGKKLHDVFFESSPSEQQAIVSRFVEESVRLSKLRHPNIVQLIGVHFSGDFQLPMMVMELLPMSLSQCLKRHQQIPAYMKTSILYDVSLGLLYLHSQTPPLIHRDLTANNVLLTSDMRAKLADFGVAKIVNLNPAQLTACMTSCPGTLSYMPPEALCDLPQYDEKLDVFSFGNLILHVCTQEWPLPGPYLASDPQNPGTTKPLTEIQRRQKYLDMIDEKNPLRALAMSCLRNFASQRPTTVDITSKLEQMHNTSATPSTGYLDMTMESLTLREQLETKKRQLRDANMQLSKENVQLRQKTQQQAHKDCMAVRPRKKKPPVPLPERRYNRPKRMISCPGRPVSVAANVNGDVIVVREKENSVTIFNKEGNEIRSFGSQGNSKGQFDQPIGVVVTADLNILVIDSGNDRVQKFTMMGEYVTSIGSEGSGPLQFCDPCGVALHPSGKLFIAEDAGCRVQVLNPDLSYSRMFGSKGTAPGQFDSPLDVACDSQGMVYVADSGNNRIQKFTPEGKFVMMIGSKESEKGELNQPMAICIDRKDRVYVGDEGNNRVSVFTSEGKFFYCFGSEGSELGKFNSPAGLAFVESDHLYVCDYRNDRVVIY